MSMRFSFSTVAVVGMALSGCANLSTIERTTPFDFNPDRNQSGKAIHLDAEQRLVIQKDFGAVCAEPSPDALTATAATLSGSVANSSDVNAALSSVLAETASSIGIRTQSIQLMRDALYRVCELYFSRALNDSQVMLLHQKYQDVMVAILAIEQLTGAVTPKAVGLNTSGQGEALSRSVDLGAAVREATERVDEAEGALAAAKADVKAKTTERDRAKATFDGLPDDPPEPKAEAKTALDAAEEALVAAQAAEESAKQTWEDEKKRLENYRDAEDAALVTVKSEARGSTIFAGGSTGSNIDKDTAKALSKAVEKIVGSVVNKTYTVDACIGMLADLDDLEGVQAKIEKNERAIHALEIRQKLSQHEGEDDGADSVSLARLTERKASLAREKRILVKQEKVISACLTVIERSLDKYVGELSGSK